jgi:hypothetical protein
LGDSTAVLSLIYADTMAEIHSANVRRLAMGFLEDAEKLAGAVAAVEGIKKLDPNASLLTEAAAAITGFEGAGAIAKRLEKKDEPAEDKG